MTIEHIKAVVIFILGCLLMLLFVVNFGIGMAVMLSDYDICDQPMRKYEIIIPARFIGCWARGPL